MGSLFQDLRYGLRLFFKSPGFTAVAVLSLALGIGANTAIFSLMDKVILRPLPVAEPERLVTVFTQRPRGLNSGFSYPVYTDYRDHNQVFSGMLAFSPTAFSLNDGKQTERVNGVLVSGNYFSVLGVSPALGRAFLPEEDKTPGTHPVVVLSYGLWQRRFGADPTLIGKTISLNGLGYTVVGVAPAEFTGLMRGSAPALYVPMMMQPQVQPASERETLTSRTVNWLFMMGRLRPGVSREPANAAMAALANRLAETYPDTTEKQIVLLEGRKGYDFFTRDLSVPLKLLLVVTALVLLIACANVANLLLGRAARRRREMAVRLAVGARRPRLIRQLLTEGVLLSAASGALGLLVAVWLIDLLVAFRPPNLAAIEAHLDRRVLGFTLLVSLLTSLVFGLAPALQATKTDLVTALKGETLTLGRGTRRLGLRNLLVVTQVALSLAVLISAGLCVRSLQRLQSIDAGFDPAKILVASVDLALNGYTEVSGRQFYGQLVGRAATLPGVESVSLARIAPLLGGGMRRSLNVEGYQPAPGEIINFNYNVVTPKYFQTLGIPLLQGRDFAPQDTPTAPKVVIINEAVAHRFWPGQNPLGHHLIFGVGQNRPGQLIEIIGVAKDAKYRSLTEDTLLTMYLPLAQNYYLDMTLHVRSASDPNQLVAALRREVRALDPQLPIFGVRTIEEQKNVSLYTSRMAAWLLALFGLLALLLAAMGIYSVMAYAVSHRTREIGIRMALGAQAGNVLRLVLGEGILLVAIGVVLGLGGAMAATRLISSFLYGVSATDPTIFALIPLLLMSVALLACYLPARRALKVDPMVALRYE